MYGKMYPVTTPPESDEFDTRHLGVTVAVACQQTGYLRIYDRSGIYPALCRQPFQRVRELLGSANLLLQKFPAEEFTATTKLTFTAKQDGEQAGMIVMGWIIVICLSVKPATSLSCNKSYAKMRNNSTPNK